MKKTQLLDELQAYLDSGWTTDEEVGEEIFYTTRQTDNGLEIETEIDGNPHEMFRITVEKL